MDLLLSLKRPFYILVGINETDAKVILIDKLSNAEFFVPIRHNRPSLVEPLAKGLHKYSWSQLLYNPSNIWLSSGAKIFLWQDKVGKNACGFEVETLSS